MITTFIIIGTCLCGILGLLIFKYLWNHFKKSNSIENKNIQVSQNLEYESNFIWLETIIEFNNSTQYTDSDNISKLNTYIYHQLNQLKINPNYIFNLQFKELNEYVTSLIENKLMKNSPSIWNKKFNDEFLLLTYKNKEFKEKNNELELLQIKIKSTIMKGWKKWKNEQFI